MSGPYRRIYGLLLLDPGRNAGELQTVDESLALYEEGPGVETRRVSYRIVEVNGGCSVLEVHAESSERLQCQERKALLVLGVPVVSQKRVTDTRPMLLFNPE